MAEVTEEMVERACKVHNVGWSLWHEPQKKTARDVMRSALTAAENARKAPIVKLLEWDGNEARSPVGCYRVQRLDDKWEPLHNGYYMLARRHGIVEAFDTFDEARAHAQADYEQRILSALSENPVVKENLTTGLSTPPQQDDLRKAVIEECAKVAEVWGFSQHDFGEPDGIKATSGVMTIDNRQSNQPHIAAAIRALAGDE